MTQKRQYAAGTYVGIGRTKDEIGEELTRLGAVRKSIAEDDESNLAVILFERPGAPGGLRVRYRITMRLPDPAADRFHYTPARRYKLDAEDARKAWRQACMEQWRALGAYVKALRLAAEAEIATTEQVLAAYVVLPHGETVHEHLTEVLPDVYKHGMMPSFLPGMPDQAAQTALPPGRVSIREDDQGK